MISEQIELRGHIIDSLLLPKVLDEILTCGGSFTIREIKIGKQRSDAPSQGVGGGMNGERGMIIASPGSDRLKSAFGLAALMASSGRPYIRAMVAALSPGPRT